MNQREPGTVLDGKYEIVQRLGSGGMGEVYLVRHVHLQELRVVKILRQDLATDPAAQARFSREARLATQIKHPNVAILYDFDQLPDGSFYMVSEHIEGENVGERLRHGGPFSVLAGLQLGIQALRGLGAIHSAGIVHRDLSPDNLMAMTEKSGLQRLKIIDLGLARTLEKGTALEITQTGTFMGKLKYCSPEQASLPQGGTIDHRSDLYSFGLVLYEMLAGVPPFESESGAGFIFKRLSEDPLPLRGRNPQVDIPEELHRVLRRALERNPDDRYPDAISFLVGLEGVLRSLDAVQTREVPVYRGAGSGSSGTPLPRQTSVSGLPKAEKVDLLAQIERAGKKAAESSGAIAAIEAALAEGRVEEARVRIARLEAANPRAPGLARAQERLQQAEAAFRQVAPPPPAPSGQLAPMAPMPPIAPAMAPPLAVAPRSQPTPAPPVAPPSPAPVAVSPVLPRPPAPTAPPVAPRPAPAAQRPADEAQRVVEAEKLFLRYLEKRQLSLARLALDGLFELDPAHPRGEELRRALARLGVEEEAARKAEAAAAATAAARDRISRAIDQKRKQFEALIATHRVVEAREMLESLEKMGLPRVTLDFLRSQVGEARQAVQLEEQIGVLEVRYRRGLEDQSWYGAREVALEPETTAPGHPRAAAMYAEIEQLESEHRKLQAAEQGVRQVEQFLAEGDRGRAELALRILVQIDPENRHRKRLEKAVKDLRK